MCFMRLDNYVWESLMCNVSMDDFEHLPIDGIVLRSIFAVDVKLLSAVVWSVGERNCG